MFRPVRRRRLLLLFLILFAGAVMWLIPIYQQWQIRHKEDLAGREREQLYYHK